MSKKRLETENKEINPYEVDKLSKIPSGLVIFILKYWAVAAAVFFTTIGGLDIGLDFSEIEGTDLVGQWEVTIRLIVIIAFATSVLFAYAVRPIVSLMNNRRNNVLRYNMVNTKGILALPVCFIYILFVSIAVFFVIMFLSIKGWVPNLFGEANYGIEPFTYGLCFIVIDGILVLIKYFIWNLYTRYKFYKQIKES